MNTTIDSIDPYRSYLHYLLISSELDQPHLSGLRWSTDGEALESTDGKVITFRTQIAHFIDGFASVDRLLPFEQILTLLLVFIGTESSSPGVIHLRKLFRDLGRPLFNAGVLAATLTKNLPRSSINLDGRMLARWLTEDSSRTILSLHQSNQGIQPEVSVLRLHEFEGQFYTALAKRTATELRFYLRNGTEPLTSTAINTTAERLQNRPHSLIERLKLAFHQSHRMSHSLGLIPVLESALHLPSRRLKSESLPLGGYTDVSNRGAPDRLLLSQFALDDDEFIRRFAERELLYFQREESYQTQALRLIILIDQGVRTWGSVRLALTAAVHVFAKWSQHRKLTFLMGTTGRPDRLVNPLEMTDAELIQLLESSDFNTSSDDLIRSTLSSDNAHDAELILLTHRKTIDDLDRSSTTLATLPESSRLFAVTADESGLIEFKRWSGSGWEQVNRCRVDYHTSETSSVVKTNLQASSHLWTGHVSPFPMPFVFGPVSRVRRFIFNLTEESVLCLTLTGQALLLHLDERQNEVLPDPNFRLIEQDPFVDAVATECGFATLVRAVDNCTHLVVYDLAHRHIHVVREFRANSICYLQHLNTIVSRSTPSQAIDLTTLGRWPCLDNNDSALISRARTACAEPKNRLPPAQSVRVLSAPGSFADYSDEPAIVIDRNTSTMRILNETLKWSTLDVPAYEASLFRKTTIESGELTRSVTAVGFVGVNGSYVAVFERECQRKPTVLSRAADSGWTLAPSGRLIAYVKRSGDVTIRNRQTAEELHVQPPRLLKHQLRLRGNEFGIELVHGRYQHLLDWSSGVLRLSVRVGISTFISVIGFKDAVDVTQNSNFNPLQSNTWNRVVSVLNCGRIIVIADNYNQVYVYRVVPVQSLVAVFLVKREYLCGWLPDGTRFGDSIVSGYPASSQSMKRFGDALSNASLNDE